MAFRVVLTAERGGVALYLTNKLISGSIGQTPVGLGG